jgi:signal peptidase I
VTAQRKPFVRVWARRALLVLCVGVLPALLASLVVRYLVPPAGTGLRGVVCVLGHRFAPYLWAALFLLFSAIARYWRRVLEGARAPAPASQRRREALAGFATVAAAATAAFALRARVAEPYRVLGPSMLPTLEPDDLVAGNKLAYAMPPSRPPGRGDVVVFRSSAIAPTGGGAPLPDVLVKRVVGLPGDRIRMRGNVPVINGWAVPTCAAGEYVYVLPDASGNMLHGKLVVEFLEDRSYLTVHAAGAPPMEEYVVKPGEVFVLGDNRSGSVDSRAYDRGRGGGVPSGAIEARAQWFLTGTHRDGESDWGRLLHPIDSMQARLRLEGLDTRALEQGISRCLSERPSVTRPPPPPDPTVALKSPS